MASHTSLNTSNQKPMKKSAILLCVILLPLSILAQQDWDWLHVFGSFEDDFMIEMTVDDMGNVYHTGLLKDSTVIDNISVGNEGDADIYIAKLNKDGITDWVISGGGPKFDRGDAIAMDDAGNLFVGGFFSDSMLWEGNWYVANGPSDMFLTKYSPDGQMHWIKTFGGSSFDVCYGIELDGNGYLYMAGHFWGDWLGDSISVSNDSTDQEALVVKLDTAGNVIWATAMGGYGNDRAYDVAIHSDGNLYVTGYFTDTVQIANDSLFGEGSFDAFIAKLDSNGTPLWARAGIGANSVEPGRIELDGVGNPYICGYYRDTARFESVELPYGGGADGYVAKYSPQGDLEWVKSLSGPGNEFLWDIEFAQSGYLFLSGDVSSAARWDSISFTGLEDRDVFLAAIDENGDLFWSETQGDLSDDTGFGIEWVDDHLIVAGNFKDTARFGEASNIGPGGFDGQIAKRNFPIQSTSIDSEKEASSFSLYPNPTDGEVWFEWKKALTERVELEILTITGKTLYVDALNPGQQRMRLHLDLPAGIYVLRVQQEGRPDAVRRLIHL